MHLFSSTPQLILGQLRQILTGPGLSWNEVFIEGFELWINRYKSTEKYYKYEGSLCSSLLSNFRKAAKEKGFHIWEIQQEAGILGKTRVDFLMGDEVALEVKFEPDYPDMSSTRKPVTNVVLKTPDEHVARYANLSSKEAKMRLYEIELDFLKLMAYKKTGTPHNYLLCLDEDGRLYRNLTKSFKTNKVRRLAIQWKPVLRGVDKHKAYYFLWQA